MGLLSVGIQAKIAGNDGQKLVVSTFVISYWAIQSTIAGEDRQIPVLTLVFLLGYNTGKDRWG